MIDKEAGDESWDKALNKEMCKVKVAWQWVDGVTPNKSRPGLVKDLIRNQEIKCHVIFDIRMEFQLKARFVAGGHTTEESNSITYSSMISREIICIGFLSAYLHGIDITDINLENAYIIELCAENI